MAQQCLLNNAALVCVFLKPCAKRDIKMVLMGGASRLPSYVSCASIAHRWACVTRHTFEEARRCSHILGDTKSNWL